MPTKMSPFPRQVAGVALAAQTAPTQRSGDRHNAEPQTAGEAMRHHVESLADGIDI